MTFSVPVLVTLPPTPNMALAVTVPALVSEPIPVAVPTISVDAPSATVTPSELAKVPPPVVSMVDPPSIVRPPVKLLAPVMFIVPPPVNTSEPAPVKTPELTLLPDWLMIRVLASRPVRPPSW